LGATGPECGDFRWQNDADDGLLVLWLVKAVGASVCHRVRVFI
jgi:hypothetical protein